MQSCDRELQQLRESESLEARRRTEFRQQQLQLQEQQRAQQQEMQQRTAAAESAAGKIMRRNHGVYRIDPHCHYVTSAASLSSEVLALRAQLLEQVCSSCNVWSIKPILRLIFLIARKRLTREKQPYVNIDRSEHLPLRGRMRNVRPPALLRSIRVTSGCASPAFFAVDCFSF